MSQPDRCHVCDKPRATERDHAAIPEGEGEGLCWAAWGTPCEPIDWRQRAERAEARVERLERETAEAEVRGALAVFRAVERALVAGYVVPVPSDERMWPSVAAEICADARAKEGDHE